MTAETTVATLIARGARRLAAAGDPMRSSAILDSELLLAHTLGGARARTAGAPRAGGRRRARHERFGELLRRRAERRAARLPHRAARVLVAGTCGERCGAGAAAGDRTVGRARPGPVGAPRRAMSRISAPDRAPSPWRSPVNGRSGASWRPTSRRPRCRRRGRTRRALGIGTVEFRQGDWFAALQGERFDLLISNPPYVAAADPALTALRHEPQLALSPGEDALCLAARCWRAAQRSICAPAAGCCLSTAPRQGAQLREELVLAGFGHVRSHTDLAGHERTTEGQR